MSKNTCVIAYLNYSRIMYWLLNILANVFGGVLAALLIYYWQYWRKQQYARNFKQIFQDKADDDFYITFCLYNNERSTVFQKPKPKVPRKTAGAVNLDKIASSASTRGVGHLVHCFGKNIRTPIKVVPDVDIDEKMDLSFVSIGGRTNYKSCDLIDDPSNVFVDFGPETIVSKSTKFPFVKAECVIDYGFIIKIHPEGNSKRTWICCSGFGEWGTSGAAWYLATHWNEIQAYANDKPFAYITKTRVGSDDSTTLLYRFLSEKEVIETSKKLNTNPSLCGD